MVLAGYAMRSHSILEVSPDSNRWGFPCYQNIHAYVLSFLLPNDFLKPSMPGRLLLPKQCPLDGCAFFSYHLLACKTKFLLHKMLCMHVRETYDTTWLNLDFVVITLYFISWQIIGLNWLTPFGEVQWDTVMPLIRELSWCWKTTQVCCRKTHTDERLKRVKKKMSYTIRI